MGRKFLFRARALGEVDGQQVSQHGRWMNALMKTEHDWKIHRDTWNIIEPAGE